MGRVILQRLPENIALTEQIFREKFGRAWEDCMVGENQDLLTGMVSLLQVLGTPRQASAPQT